MITFNGFKRSPNMKMKKNCDRHGGSILFSVAKSEERQPCLPEDDPE